MSLFIYQIFLFLYSLGIRIVSLWNKKARLWITGRRNIFTELERKISAHTGTKLVWMHCASLGEFEQGRPLLEKIRDQEPKTRILLTFFSPSGYEIRKNYAGADHIFYLPLDSHKNACRFLDLIKPDLILWVKYEYWYFYLDQIKRRGIPAILVSGIFREDQPFFKWYGTLHRQMLQSFVHLFVQNNESKTLSEKIVSPEKITSSGDTRFDRVLEIASSFRAMPVIEKFCGNSKVIVAGSTWDEDEEEIDHYANTHPELRFIIAPHEIDEEHLVEMEKLFKYCIRFSVFEKNADALLSEGKENKPNVLIIDNIGMLSRLYHYGTICYIGGGFGEDGIHNALEAAVYGKPVVFGPVYDKFAEAIGLVEASAAFSVENALELEEVFDKLLTEEDLYKKAGDAAKDYVYDNIGASDKIMKFISQYLR